MREKIGAFVTRALLTLFNPYILPKLSGLVKKYLNRFTRATLGYVLVTTGISWLSGTDIPSLEEIVEKFKEPLAELNEYMTVAEKFSSFYERDS